MKALLLLPALTAIISIPAFAQSTTDLNREIFITFTKKANGDVLSADGKYKVAVNCNKNDRNQAVISDVSDQIAIVAFESYEKCEAAKNNIYAIPASGKLTMAYNPENAKVTHVVRTPNPEYSPIELKDISPSPNGYNATFSGALAASDATGWIYGSLTSPSNGVPLGAIQSIRTNLAGDRVVLRLSKMPNTGGVGYRNIVASADLHLTPSTMSYIEFYCGGGKPSGIALPTGAEVGGPYGGLQLSGQVLILGANGQACIYAENEQAIDDGNPKIASNNKDTKVSSSASSDEKVHVAEIETATKAL